MQTFKTQAREASQHSPVVGTKTNNSETPGNHRVAKEVGSGRMAFGTHPVECKEPLEILIRSHMSLVIPERG